MSFPTWSKSLPISIVLLCTILLYKLLQPIEVESHVSTPTKPAYPLPSKHTKPSSSTSRITTQQNKLNFSATPSSMDKVKVDEHSPAAKNISYEEYTQESSPSYDGNIIANEVEYFKHVLMSVLSETRIDHPLFEHFFDGTLSHIPEFGLWLIDQELLNIEPWELSLIEEELSSARFTSDNLQRLKRLYAAIRYYAATMNSRDSTFVTRKYNFDYLTKTLSKFSSANNLALLEYSLRDQLFESDEILEMTINSER